MQPTNRLAPSHQLHTVQTSVPKSWNDRAITHLKNFKHALEEKIPNNSLQTRIDELGRTIRDTFAPLVEFNKKLNSNGIGPWYDQLAVYLVKLPFRAARNIAQLLYAIVKTALYAAVHPMKALLKLAKLLVMLAHELQKPEAWSKMGVGMVGASMGQSLVSGNPFPLIGLVIGTAMAFGGITVGALKAVIERGKDARLEALGQHLLLQAKELPEAGLTGFCLGLIMGGIQRARAKMYRPDFEEVRKFGEDFIKKHNLPPDSSITIDKATGKIEIKIQGLNSIGELEKKCPELIFNRKQLSSEVVPEYGRVKNRVILDTYSLTSEVKIGLSPSSIEAIATYNPSAIYTLPGSGDFMSYRTDMVSYRWLQPKHATIPLEALGIDSAKPLSQLPKLWTRPAEDIAINTIGTAVGAVVLSPNE